MSSSNRPKKHIIVLGAGVTGLQTAISLLTHPTTSSNFAVTIIASHIPGDLAASYTSPWAGGHWRSHVTTAPGDAEIRAFDKRTYEYWMNLLAQGGENESVEEREERLGLGVRESRYFWGKEGEETRGGDGRGLWWRDVVEGFEVLDLKSGRGEKGGYPDGAVMGIRYKSVCINVPRYLQYLLERVKALGARVIKKDIETGEGGLTSVVRAAKSILLAEEKDLRVSDIYAFINCAGISAAKFIGADEGAKVFPILGQTVLVRGEAPVIQTYVSAPGSSESELQYVIPRPGSGTTILGGCKKRVEDWSSGVDEELSTRILRNVVKYKLLDPAALSKQSPPRSGGQIREGFEVISAQVGFRPGRTGGPRVEVEGGRKVEGLLVVHSYGHSGAGYQNSVGSAEKVVGLIGAVTQDGEIKSMI